MSDDQDEAMSGLTMSEPIQSEPTMQGPRMERIPGLGGALGDFRISPFPPEMFMMIAEELGRHIRQQPALLQDASGVVPDDEVGSEVSEVTQYLVQSFPTLQMLTAGMVNKYFYAKIRDVALRWDAAGSAPKAVHFAAVKSNVGLLQRALIQPKSNPDFVPEDCCTPLLTAINNGNLEGVHLLLDHGANMGPDRRWVVPFGDIFVDNPTTMIDQNFYLQEVDVTPLHYCMIITPKRPDVALAILSRLPPEFNTIITDEGQKLLALAVATNYVELIGPLIERGAPLDQGGVTVHGRQTPLMHHATSREMVLRLMQAGVAARTPAAVGLNALHAVCLRRMDCREAIDELVKQQNNVDEPTAGSWARHTLIQAPDMMPIAAVPPTTALGLACRQLNYVHVRRLLDHGANPYGTNHVLGARDGPNSGNYYQVSPLHDLFLPDDLGGHPYAGSGPAISSAILESMAAIFGRDGSEALLRRHNVAMSDRVRLRAARIEARLWSHDRIARNAQMMGLERAASAYTPFELFFLQPLVDDERIPQAMLDACRGNELAQQVNNRMTPYAITPLIALLSNRVDHARGEANFYRPRLVEWLLQHGADPNITDAEGFSPLHYAAFWLDTAAIRLLLRYGARTPPPGTTDIMTPLEVALGALYTRKQVTDQDNLSPGVGSWQSMVELIDDNTRGEIVGLTSCVTRWKPVYEFPACAFPAVERRYHELELDDADLHSDLVHPGLCHTVMVREMIRTKRHEVVQMLIQGGERIRQPGHPNTRQPAQISARNIWLAGMNPVPPTPLDWASASTTSDDREIAETLIAAGARFSVYPPNFSSWNLSDRLLANRWLEVKDWCRVNHPQAIIDHHLG
ncbi:ankyrin unc44 [Colletotrichum musicola]|uniref:Ankyrin unc44 n=1 Tax=Colletotrichum musicola TaxID=2175873 RepID=A0A8H6KJ90_9PEZI|nr:ankyrin unc44 [Colletotrichum musicola]